MKDINILMLGGKRCGKTTVLSAMCNEINNTLKDTGMQICIDDEKTKQDIEAAGAHIRNKIKAFDEPLTRIVIDGNPTSASKVYSFRLSFGKRNGGIPFRMHDIPGEWLTDALQEQRVRELIRQCQVIIIAIDTPYLFSKMTDKGYGYYHEEYNKPMEITNFLKNSLSVEDVKDRMILFVPLKCERYYHLEHTKKLNIFGRKYMNELVDAVSHGYLDLLRYLRSWELSDCCTIAITPILSAGGIDFVRFQKDSETGRMAAMYQEPEFLPESERGYCPKFCEQPMVYAMVYSLKRTLREQEETEQLPKLGEGKNPTQIQSALQQLQKKMKRNMGLYPVDGYFIIQNPENI